MNIMTLGTSLWKRYKRLRAEREKTSDERSGTRETAAEKWGERIEWKPFLASICPNRTKMNRLRFGLNKVKNTNISWQYIRFVCVIYYTCASKDKWPLIRIDIFSLSTPKKNGFLLPVFFSCSVYLPRRKKALDLIPCAHFIFIIPIKYGGISKKNHVTLLCIKPLMRNTKSDLIMSLDRWSWRLGFHMVAESKSRRLTLFRGSLSSRPFSFEIINTL